MIACTSPAGTLSDTPFRIGLPATVACRSRMSSKLIRCPPELVSRSISPRAQRSPQWIVKQVQHDGREWSLRLLRPACRAVVEEVAAHRVHRVLADAFEQALVVERLLPVVEVCLLQ